MARAKAKSARAVRTAPAAVPAATSESRPMRFVKQGGVVVGLLSGIVGLVFLLFPQLRPERHEPAANQSAAITGVVVNPHTTHGQFLDYSDQSKLGFTKAQLAVVGASAFARVQIVGYRGKKLTLERQVVDARTGDVIGATRDFLVQPPANDVTHRWWDWTPLRAGRGSYIIVIKLLDEEQKTAIACRETPIFGGADGQLPAEAPHVCEAG